MGGGDGSLQTPTLEYIELQGEEEENREKRRQRNTNNKHWLAICNVRPKDRHYEIAGILTPVPSVTVRLG